MMCDKCVHNAVCCDEGKDDGLTFCADFMEKRNRGEWIIDGHHIRCNRCNEYICTKDREGAVIPNNFCPNCGSDMRPKEGEAE